MNISLYQIDTTTTAYLNAEKELYFWQYSYNDNFSAMLFKLIGKADFSNRFLLSQGFPNEVDVYTRYEQEIGYWESVQKKFEGK